VVLVLVIVIVIPKVFQVFLYQLLGTERSMDIPYAYAPDFPLVDALTRITARMHRGRYKLAHT